MIDVDSLLDCMDISGTKKFVIFPYGKIGHAVALALKNRRLDYVCCDNRLCGTESGFLDFAAVNGDDRYRGYTLLFTAMRSDVRTELLPLYHSWSGDKYDFLQLTFCRDLFAPIAINDCRAGALDRAAREITEKNVAGSVAEAGVFRGDFARLINLAFPQKKLYLCDTFEGFDDRDVCIERTRGWSDGKQDWSDTSVELVLSKMTFQENCIVRKGYFPESMTGIDDTFCFVSLDLDLYKPIFDSLAYFYPRLSKGGYIFIHDCVNKEYPGARKAVLEFCEKQNIGYVILPDDWGTAVIAK